jgi:hypothetical protein
LELCTHGEHLTIWSLDNPLSKPIRVDSLIAVHTPVPEDRISESLSSIPEVDSATPPDTSKSVLTRVTEDKTSKGLSSVPELDSATTLANPTLATPTSPVALPLQVFIPPHSSILPNK